MKKSNTLPSGIGGTQYQSGTSKYPALYSIEDICHEIEKFRKVVEDALDQIVSTTPNNLRREIWDNSEITDEKVFDHELEKAKALLNFYWGYATMLLSEGGNEPEYNRVLRIMRDKYLIIDALDNSSKGPGELV